jgi:hypothetical protein
VQRIEAPFPERLRASSDFFMRRDDVHAALTHLASRLREEEIDYAIVGAMALNAHGYRRETVDVDVLTTDAGLTRIHEVLVGRGYVPRFPGARKKLRDVETGVDIDFITAGDYPGDGKPKPVRFPEPALVSEDFADVRVIRLDKLIELKLASGLSASDRLKDLADVQETIRALDLPRDLGLDESVRSEYERLWDGIQAARENRFAPDNE